MPVATNSDQSANILVVDDDIEAREQLRVVFESAGYRVSAAGDATSALRLLQREACDLVVIDLALSGVDGLALCKILRAQPSTSKLPLIALSNNEVESQKLEVFAAGADD